MKLFSNFRVREGRAVILLVVLAVWWNRACTSAFATGISRKVITFSSTSYTFANVHQEGGAFVSRRYVPRMNPVSRELVPSRTLPECAGSDLKNLTEHVNYCLNCLNEKKCDQGPCCVYDGTDSSQYFICKAPGCCLRVLTNPNEELNRAGALIVYDGVITSGASNSKCDDVKLDRSSCPSQCAVLFDLSNNLQDCSEDGLYVPSSDAKFRRTGKCHPEKNDSVSPTPTPSTSPSESPRGPNVPVGAIAGGAAGLVALIAAMALGIVFYFRKKKDSNHSDPIPGERYSDDVMSAPHVNYPEEYPR